MKLNRTILFVFGIAAYIFSSCGGPSRTVSFNVTRPAEITLPAEANTILLVDRTKFKNGTLNVIEGILTGEMPNDDRNAAHEALMTLKSTLDNSPRFNVKILPERLEGNSMTASFPSPLSWTVVDQLCVNHQADIVVCLEVYDSNFIVTNGKRTKKKFVGEGANKKEVEYNEFYAQGLGKVKMGIRTYYSKNKTIVDEQLVDKSNSWEGAGATPMDALALLISKSNANKYLADMVGEDYAYKISPLPMRLARPFYGKAKHAPEVATGSRFADVAQWEQAIDEWKKGVDKADTKVAGKLAYNIAVGYEVLGEYGTALTWAQNSYTKYGNKNGRDYVRILQQRINQENILKRQMGKE